MTIARRTSTYVGVALLGGAIGLMAGLLIAPAAGNDTRRRIARRSIEDQELLLRRAEMGMDLPWDELDLPVSA
jgi:gas vesicle protein